MGNETPAIRIGRRAIVAAKIKPVYEKQAKERQKMSGGDVRNKKTVPVNLPEPNSDARDEAGKQLNVSGKSVDQASKVLLADRQQSNQEGN